MRLDKYLALASIGTRKVVKEYIYQGKVKVNGIINYEPYFIINEKEDVVEYLDHEIKNTKTICYIFNKPQGCITARSDATDKTVFDYFNGIDTSGLFPVGRLDKNTEGLLLITNNGDLNHQLMHPEKHIEKTYYFWAVGTVSEEGIKCIEEGVDIGYESITKPAKIVIVKKGMYTELAKIMENEGCTTVKKHLFKQEVVAGYITISEGMKHQVKRMLKHIGCYVVYLKRVSIGNLVLDESLKKGEYRILSEKEWKDKIY